MNDLNVIIVVFLSLLLGIICLAATANGWHIAARRGYIVGGRVFDLWSGVWICLRYEGRSSSGQSGS